MPVRRLICRSGWKSVDVRMGNSPRRLREFPVAAGSFRQSISPTCIGIIVASS